MINTCIQCCRDPNSSDWALSLDMSRQLCWWAMSPQASHWGTCSFKPLSLKKGWALPWRSPAHFLFSWGNKKKYQVSPVCRDKLSLEYWPEETSRFTSAVWSRWKFSWFEMFACLVCLCKAIPSLQAGLPQNPFSRVPHWSPSPLAVVWLYLLAFSLCPWGHNVSLVSLGNPASSTLCSRQALPGCTQSSIYTASLVFLHPNWSWGQQNTKMTSLGLPIDGTSRMWHSIQKYVCVNFWYVYMKHSRNISKWLISRILTARCPLD